MKTLVTIFVLALSVSGTAIAQNTSDSTGLPGDNLDLYGVLELFKKAESMEAFEKSLNEETSLVNNLDLNGDNETDYIRVIDRVEGTSHAITLQVPVSEKESQDVAVIEIEKTGEESADLQIVGDEDIYGKDYIIEAADETSTKEMPEIGPVRVVVNVWLWPSVRFIYGPKYVIWSSPYYWRHYPHWYKPWRPVAWRVHHRRVLPYHAHCRRVAVHRTVVAHRVYHRHRVGSPVVHNRYKSSPHPKKTPVKQGRGGQKKSAPRKPTGRK